MKKNAFPLLFLAFYIVWIIRATWFYSAVDATIGNEILRLAFSIFVKFTLWVLPAAAFIYWLDGENPLEKMKINTPIDKNNLVLVIVSSLLYFVFVFLFEYFASNRTLLPLIQSPLMKVLNTLAAGSLSPVIEEMLFRGFVLYKLETKYSFWKANILQAFLFTAMHWPYWLWTQSAQAQIVVTSVGIFLLAIFLGWVLKKRKAIPPGRPWSCTLLIIYWLLIWDKLSVRF